MADPLRSSLAPQAAATSLPARPVALAAARRSVWLKTLHQWHWISSAVCLIGILLFSITGITLNHSSQIEARPVVVSTNHIDPQLV